MVFWNRFVIKFRICKSFKVLDIYFILNLIANLFQRKPFASHLENKNYAKIRRKKVRLFKTLLYLDNFKSNMDKGHYDIS